MPLREEKGFSLVELAVVLIIAGFVLAMSTPAIHRYLLNARLRDAGSRIAGEMRLARQKAVTNNSRNWFYTVAGTNYYYTGEQRWLGGSTFGPTVWRGPIYLPSTVRVLTPNWGAGYSYFWYTPDGRPSTTAATGPVSGSVRLVTLAGEPDTVTVNVDLSGSVWH